MKFKRPKDEHIEINLTPMIDCLLFLVVFLLLSTTFNKYSRLNLILPEASGVPAKKKGDKIEVAINADGQYTVEGNSIGKSDESELMAAIRHGIEGKGVVPLVIIADGRASHQSVVRAMNSAGRLGLVNINISTKVPAGAGQ